MYKWRIGQKILSQWTNPSELETNGTKTTCFERDLKIHKKYTAVM